MDPLVREFEEAIASPEGDAYIARVIGTERRDGKWEGRLSFVPVGGDDSKALTSARESLQSDYNDLQYWADGLTPRLLQGSLERLLTPESAAPVSGGARHVLEVDGVDDRVPAELMGTFTLQRGLSRTLPGGAVLEYDETSYTNSGSNVHRFNVFIRDSAEGAASWLCHHLQGARVLLNGEKIALEDGAFSRALGPRS